MDWIEVAGVRFLKHEMGEASVVFGSRLSGDSLPPYESLNVGIGTGDDPELVARNRGSLSKAAGLKASAVVMARQVHGDLILRHETSEMDGPWARGTMPHVEADGHITETRGIGLAVITADCLPIAIEGKRGLALVHCGWRGLAAGLAQKAAELVHGERAIIGPGIGPCCYEVGEQVANRFADYHGALDGDRLDLVQVGRLQLQVAGVAAIESTGLCTCCQDGDFFSHRRDGEKTGRQGTLAWLN